jgi:hypothetical protein
MSIWTLVITTSTSSVTFKNKFGIGQKGTVNLFLSFQSVDL